MVSLNGRVSEETQRHKNGETVFSTSNYGDTEEKKKTARASHHIHYRQPGKYGLLTANRHRRAAVSQVNSFQLQEWLSPSWISLCLSRQTRSDKAGRRATVGLAPAAKETLSKPSKCLFRYIGATKSCQGNTCSPASLSCESQ